VEKQRGELQREVTVLTERVEEATDSTHVQVFTYVGILLVSYMKKSFHNKVTRDQRFTILTIESPPSFTKAVSLPIQPAETTGCLNKQN